MSMQRCLSLFLLLAAPSLAAASPPSTASLIESPWPSRHQPRPW